MRARHTPGPWAVSRSVAGHLAPFAADGRHLLHEDGGIPLEEREANARVIEAAPALLACCRALRCYAGGGLPESLWRRLLDALAIADGDA